MEDIIDIIVTETTNIIEITSQPTDEVIDVNIIDNRENVTLNVTPTLVEVNINSLVGNFGVNWGDITGTLSNQTDLNTALGLKADLVGGKVPSSQLPSYVDDIVEVATYSALPATGETGKIYVVLDTNLIYRWSGSAYIEIKDSSAVWGAITGTLSSQTDLQSALNAKFNNPSGDTTQYIAGDGSLITFPVAGQAGTLVRQVRNTTGATLTKGTIVYINGASGNKPTVTKAIATGDSTSAQTFGFVQADISNNSNGYVVCNGDLIGLDTSAVTEGTQLYLSSTTAGAYTTTKQVAPAHLVYVGVITRSHPTQGQIEVKIQNGYELDEIHDVLITSKANNDGLFYESSSGLWKNKTIANVLGYTPEQPLSFSSPLSRSTNTVSIPVATSSANGYLSSTDWTTFNSKQAALSGTGFVKISGTTISYDNSTYALDSAVVKLTGDQTIAGIKTFSSVTKSTQFMVGSPFDTSRTFSAAGNAHTIALWLEEYSLTGTGAPDIFFNNGRGTISSKANIQVGDGLGGITWAGYVNSNFNGSAGFGAIVVNIDSTNNQANADITIDQSYNSASATNNFRLYANGGGLYIRGNVQGASFVKAGGTSSQFLKADGSVDSSTYLTTSLAASTYLPLSGGTLTGALEVNSDITIPNGNFFKAKRSTGSAAIGVLGFASGSDSLTVKGGTSGGNISIKFEDTGGTIAAFYNGNFGINTTSAAYKLDVNGTGNFAGTLRVSHSTSGGYGGIIYNTSSSGEGLTIRGGSTSSHNSLIVQNYNGSTSLLSVLANGVTTHTAIDDSGNRTNPFNSLIITTDNPSVPYTGFGGSILFNNRSYTHGIVTTSRIRSVIYDDGANQGGGFIFETTPTAGGTLTPSLSLTYDNFILIGKTAAGFSTAGSQFQNSGKLFGVTNDGSGENIFLHRSGSNTGNLMAFFYNAGGIGSISTNGTTTSYNITSDYRLKEDLKPINGLEIVSKIKVYNYKWKSEDSRMDGVLAHELQEVLPYAVFGVKDGETMQGVDYSKIVPVMVQAIKDLKAELDTLKNK